MASINTYHCLCTELILATAGPIQNFLKREHDGSIICTLTHEDGDAPATGDSTLVNSTFERSAVVLRLEDGFEKRYAIRCQRCRLLVGYQLHWSQFDESRKASGQRDDVIYILPGGFMSTEEMEAGKSMEKEVELVARVAG
ncbi:hypothetical protein K431DRAFT_224273 [Polychaeton citri CBS 116435]|uniref:STEEP1 domain-containing protein n=1 Tax=Polychaeton citri CBS 116435 TaxID=1314669 RepID=A0A9P4Q8L5_9PEZI|nr:hypothetical protein K431DRAFT_224273 [Polychaeton citri CBS 116435]